MYAVRFDPEPRIALVPLDLGANPSVANSAGQTALDLVPYDRDPRYASAGFLGRLAPPVSAPTRGPAPEGSTPGR